MVQGSHTLPELQFHMMGALTIVRSDVGLLGSLNKKEQALLCYVKVNGRPCSRREIETLLWPESPKPKVNLRVAINHLRQAGLEPFLDISDEAIAFNQQNHWSDVEAFSYQLAHLSAKPKGDITALMHVVDQCGDTFLPDFAIADSPQFEEWKYWQRLHLKQQLIRALELLIKSCLEREDRIRMWRYAERLMRCAPWHKQARQYLAYLDDGAGDPAQPTLALPDLDPTTQSHPNQMMPWDEIDASTETERLSLSESLALLRFQRGSDSSSGSEAALRLLCQLLDFHPLGLALIGRFLRERPYTSLHILNRQLASYRQQLSAETTVPGLQTALAVCYAGLKPSMRELMQKVKEFGNRPFSVQDAARLVQQPPPIVQDDLDYLVRLALLRSDDAAHYWRSKALLLAGWQSDA